MSSFITANIDSAADQIKLNFSGQYGVVVTESGNLYYSSDYCVSFTLSSLSGITLNTGYPNQIACSSSGQHFAFVDQSTGVWYSSNYGQDWTNVSPSLFTSITAKDDFSRLIALNGTNTTYYSTNNGTSWIAYLVITPLATLYNISGNSQFLVATTSNGKLYHSTDSGATWTQYTNVPVYNYNSACISQNGNVLYATQKNGIHFIYSTDAGVNWTTVSITIGSLQSVSCDNDGSVASITSSDAGGGGLYYTVDTCTNLEKKNLVGPSDQWICTSVSGNGLYISSGDSGHNNVYTFLPIFVINLTFVIPSSTTIDIPLQESAQNYSVNWGDGNTTQDTLTHTYSSSGTYVVDITIDSGTFTSFGTSPWASAVYLQSINSWSDTFQDLSYACYGATSLVSVPTNLPANCTNLSNMFNGSSINQNIGTWNISGISIPGMTGMLDNSGMDISNYDSILNGWATGLPVPTGITLGAYGIYYDATGLLGRNALINNYGWTIIGDIYSPLPICYAKGVKILTRTGYIVIEHLLPGDLIKTYRHGYIPIELIRKGKFNNDPTDWKKCMYRLPGIDGHDDLIVTGGHGILKRTLTSREIQIDVSWFKNNRRYSKIDGLYLQRAAFCKDFRQIKSTEEYTYYHLSLKGSQRYGIWANGILSESTFSRNILNKIL
jgi:photosystem II stability/assembly factor-like uncharacterized protein